MKWYLHNLKFRQFFDHLYKVVLFSKRFDTSDDEIVQFLNIVRKVSAVFQTISFIVNTYIKSIDSIIILIQLLSSEVGYISIRVLFEGVGLAGTYVTVR